MFFSNIFTRWQHKSRTIILPFILYTYITQLISDRRYQTVVKSPYFITDLWSGIRYGHFITNVHIQFTNTHKKNSNWRLIFWRSHDSLLSLFFPSFNKEHLVVNRSRVLHVLLSDGRSGTLFTSRLCAEVRSRVTNKQNAIKGITLLDTRKS